MSAPGPRPPRLRRETLQSVAAKAASVGVVIKACVNWAVANPALRATQYEDAMRSATSIRVVDTAPEIGGRARRIRVSPEKAESDCPFDGPILHRRCRPRAPGRDRRRRDREDRASIERRYERWLSDREVVARS